MVVWKGEEIGGNARMVTQTLCIGGVGTWGGLEMYQARPFTSGLAQILDPRSHKGVAARSGKRMLTGKFRLMHYTPVALSRDADS